MPSSPSKNSHRSANENLARYKHPKDLLIVAELPRNASGKVVKVRLRKDYSV